jgi:hypothetical protein
LCEAFPGVPPTRMLWELENDPDQWALKIVEIRAYERAMAVVDGAKKPEDIPQSALTDEVLDNRFELNREWLDDQKQRAQARGSQRYRSGQA